MQSNAIHPTTERAWDEWLMYDKEYIIYCFFSKSS